MDRASISFWLSIFGASTGVPLAIIKIYEFFDTRRVHFTASVRLTSSDDIGNTIVLLNQSSIPASIYYYDLVWVERRRLLGVPVPFTKKIIANTTPIDGGDAYDVTVAPHDTHTLTFTEENHFDWGGHLKQDIYLRVSIIGRSRPLWLWVTGPSKYK